MKYKRGLRITFIFGGQEISGVYDRKNKIYYFSVVDIIHILSNVKNPKRKWTDLKYRLIKKDNKLYSRCKKLKMKSLDGRMRYRDAFSLNAVIVLLKYIKSSKRRIFKSYLLELRNIELD